MDSSDCKKDSIRFFIRTNMYIFAVGEQHSAAPSELPQGGNTARVGG
jgi:hypothetical protein